MRRGLTFLLTILLIPVVFGGLGCRRSGHPSEEELTPPAAKVVPETLEMHGHTWVDNYTWMKDVPRTSPETIAYVEAENAYTDAVMRHTEKFQEKLFKEMKARIKETDLEVPVRIDDYYYYSRTEEGQNYRIYCRKQGSEDAPEQIILDVNELAEGFEFYQVGRLSRSPDHRILAFPADTTGAEKYVIRFKNLDTGEFLPDELYPVRAVTWAEDNRTLFYTRPVDPDIETPYQCYRHVLGTSQDEDIMLYQEDDLAWALGVGKSRSKKFIFLYAGDNETSEIRYLLADKPNAKFRLFAPRKREVEYSLVHWQDRFFIVTNEDDAKNYKILWTPVDRPARANWKEYIGHREDVYVTGFDEFKKYVAIHERKDGLETIRVIDMLTSQTSYVTFPEPTYAFWSGSNPNYDTKQYRITYMSFVTPRSIYDIDLATQEMTLLKQTEVLSGFDPAEYKSERIFATARDGARVPISLVYRRDKFKQNGNNLLYLYAYGAYGISMTPYFSTTRISLLDRGFVYAMAHIRGGTEMGETWHEQGKKLNKKNTYYDLIDCAEFFIGEKYTRADRLVVSGGSAGGMLAGVVANWRPDLFAVVIADVPAMDELTHMLDPELPGVEFHYTEWGNPNIKEEFEYFYSWDAYQNVRAQDYPHMLVTSGLQDPRVPYWEPTKWVAKVRAMKTDDNVLILKTKMAGHGGASGRYDYLKEIAFQFAFILDRLGFEK